MGQSVAEIAYRGVGGNARYLFHVLLFRRGQFQKVPVGRVNVLDRFGKLLGEVGPFDG